MEETLLQKDKLALTRKNLLDYFETHDVKYIADDAIFKHMGTGETWKGKAEVGAMLHYMYQVAFDAHADFTSNIIAEDKAQVEGFFVGKHIGEYAGIKPTQKQVRVPLCVTYQVKDGLIKEAHIYLQNDVMMQQLGATESASRQKTTFVVRDIFKLKFGHFREAKKLLDEANEKAMMPESKQPRVLTDFTGESYRLIFEEGFDSLSDYEFSLGSSMKTDEWQHWYERFKPHIESSYREILKQIN